LRTSPRCVLSVLLARCLFDFFQSDFDSDYLFSDIKFSIGFFFRIHFFEVTTTALSPVFLGRESNAHTPRSRARLYARSYRARTWKTEGPAKICQISCFSSNISRNVAEPVALQLIEVYYRRRRRW
jgi:hypothetical protein